MLERFAFEEWSNVTPHRMWLNEKQISTRDMAYLL